MSNGNGLQQAAAALQRGDVELARQTCDAWLKKNPQDVNAIHLRGRCLATLGAMDAAMQDFQRALRTQPNHFLALADLGMTLAALGRPKEAAVQLAAALAQDDRPPELHFALGQCRLGYGDLQGAGASFDAAVARRPRFADAHNNRGVVFDRLGDPANAMRCFEQARVIEPTLVRAHRNLADILRRQGRAGEAVGPLQQAAAAQPGDLDLLCELSESMCDVGRWEDAVGVARAVILRAPRNARAYAAAGMALLGADRCAAAAESLEQALNLDPQLAYAAVNLGEALLRLQRPELAMEAYRKALNVRSAPIEAQLGLGRAQHAVGQFLHRRGQLEDALANYGQALAIVPNDVRMILDRAHALESLGRLADAVAGFERARELQSQCAEALAGLVSCAFRRCDWSRAASALTALEALPDGLDCLHPFLLLAAGVSPAQQLSVLQRRALRFESNDVTTRAPVVVRPLRARLRVAYLSADFREHAVGHAIVSVIESHDRSVVEPIGVSFAAADGSAVGRRLRSAFEQFLDASTLSDGEVLARLRELDVDIAVDLAGFTTGARTEIFAARCAPVQVNFLGFPATMGTPFMDYMIADEVVVPASEEHAYAERIVRLAQCYLPLDCTRVVSRGNRDRAGAGLPMDALVLCAFNNSYKVTRHMFGVWMSLLRDIPDGVLWLRSMGADATGHLRRAAGESGVDSSRLIFAPFIAEMDEYLARLQCADLFLDTLPYNAHTTAADALWAGVPVVSCRGNSFAGRVGASLLGCAGLSDLICASVDEYRLKVLSLAGRRDELRRVRDRLAAATRTAPLFDTGAYTRNLEALYVMMAKQE
jgi:protein O-GlcNAc transferase